MICKYHYTQNLGAGQESRWCSFKCRSYRAEDRLRPLYVLFRINFPWSVDRSDCVAVQAYLCRCRARMSPVLIISNRCDSTILSNPTIWYYRRFTVHGYGNALRLFSTFTTAFCILRLDSSPTPKYVGSLRTWLHEPRHEKPAFCNLCENKDSD